MSIYQAVFWGFVAFVALVLAYGLVQEVRRAHQPKPQPAQPAPVAPRCDTTGCPYSAWIPVTRRDTNDSSQVCAGCWAEGEAYGWWAA